MARPGRRRNGVGTVPDQQNGRGRASALSNLVLTLDVLLLIALVLLLSPRMTGLPRHELLGAAFILPVLLHLIIARPWIRGAGRSLLRATHTRTRINFLLNSILFALIVSEIFSGLVISQALLPSMGWLRINDRTWRAVHNQGLNWIRLLVSIHIAANWNWMVATYRRLREARPKRIVFARTTLSTLAWAGAVLFASALVAAAIYGLAGHPTVGRLYPQNEIARFRPTLGHALLQFLGQTLMISFGIYAARRWLRARI